MKVPRVFIQRLKTLKMFSGRIRGSAVLALAICLLATCVSLMVFSNAASTKQIPIIITNMSIRHNSSEVSPGSVIEFKNGDIFTMDFLWEVDYSGVYISIENGDYSGVLPLWAPGSLPININYGASGLTADLISEEEDASHNVTTKKIGSFTLGYGGVDGSVKMTFNDALKDLGSVHGTLHVETTIRYDESIEAEEQVFFHNESFSYTFAFTNNTESGADVHKSNHGYEGSSLNDIKAIHWQTDVNTVLSHNPVSNTVYDAPASGGAYASHLIDAGSIKVYRLDVDLYHGTVTAEPTPLDAGYTVSVSTDKKTMSITFDDLSSKAYRITYDTKPDSAYSGSNTVYLNKAELGSGGPSSEAQFERIVTPDEFVNVKSGTFIGETPTSKSYIVWTITINKYGFEATEPITVSDILGPWHSVRSDSIKVYRKTYDRNTGKHTAREEPALIAGTDYSISDLTDTSFDITINSPIKDGNGNFYTFEVEYITDTSTVDGYTYTNTAEFNGGNSPVTASVIRTTTVKNEPTAVKTAPETWRVMGKDGAGNELPLMGPATSDAGLRLIPWTIVISPIGNTLTDIEITDTYSYSYNNGDVIPDVPASMKLYSGDKYPPFVVELGRDDKWTPVDASDYTLTDKGTGGFTFTYNKPLEGFQLRVRYYTQYELPKRDGNGQVNFGNAVTYTNTADVSAKVNGMPKTWSPTVNRNVAPTAEGVNFLNGSKSGHTHGSMATLPYGVIEWTIAFNQEHIDMGGGNVTIADRWGSEENQEQEMIPGSLKVSPSSVQIASGPTVDSDRKGFTLSLSGINTSEVTLTYQTYRVGAPFTGNYFNTVTIGNWTPIRGSVWLTGDTLFSKSAALGSDDKTISWSLDVNTVRYNLRNAVLVDTLGVGQILDESSIEVFDYNSAGTALLTTALIDGTDYTVDIVCNPASGITVLTIEFLEPFSTRRSITYSSRVDDDTIAKNAAGVYEVSNVAVLTGDNVVSSRVEYMRSDNLTLLSGTGSGIRIPVYVIKQDAQTGDALKDAEFMLTDSDGAHEYLTDPVVTGTAGKTFVAYLPPGTYRLYEVKIPEGYIPMDPEYVEFTVLATDTPDKTVIIENERKPGVPPPETTDPETGTLNLTKTVAYGGSTAKSFDFTVTFSNAEQSVSGILINGAVFVSGSKVSLAHGGTASFTNIPLDTEYVIAEADYSSDGYDSDRTDNTATGKLDSAGTASVTFVNTYTPPDETPNDPGEDPPGDTPNDPPKDPPDEKPGNPPKDPTESAPPGNTPPGTQTTTTPLPTTTPPTTSATPPAETPSTPPAEPSSETPPSSEPGAPPSDTQAYPPAEPLPEPPAIPVFTPGGRDHDAPPVPAHQEDSLVWDEDLEMWIEFGEDGVPLGSWHWDPDEEMWIFDDDIPLAGFDPGDANLPQTGKAGPQAYLIALLGFSLIGIGAAIRATARRRKV